MNLLQRAMSAIAIANSGMDRRGQAALIQGLGSAAVVLAIVVVVVFTLFAATSFDNANVNTAIITLGSLLLVAIAGAAFFRIFGGR